MLGTPLNVAGALTAVSSYFARVNSSLFSVEQLKGGQCLQRHPGEMPEGSRGSSEAIPPVRHGKDLHPGPDIS